jgi:hypothetical protein
MYRCALAGLAAACLVAPAAAWQRSFPQNALRGAIVVASPTEATLNDQPAALSPAVRIRGQNNLLVLSSNVVGQRLLVHYTRDLQGLVNAIWILTPDEAARTPWPTTTDEAQAWRFDPVAQVWSKP